MSEKTLIIGVDGFDSITLEQLEETQDLWISETQKLSYSTVFPPDTTPAWTSFYLNEDPSFHGIVNFPNPFDSHFKKRMISDETLMGKTWWDKLSATEKVVVCLPMNIDKGWGNKNLTMLSRPSELNNMSFYLNGEPTNLFHKTLAGPISLNDKSYSPNKHKMLLANLENRLEKEFYVFREFLGSQNWDTAFCYVSSLDAIQHFFPHYSSPIHPTYSSGNPFETTISDFYIKLDNLIQVLVQEQKNLDRVFILSDHGHGLRPWKIVHLNEFFRRKGFLYCNNAKTKGTSISPIKLMDIFKRLPIPKMLVNRIKKSNLIIKTLEQSNGIDFNKSLCAVSGLSSFKQYEYGGVWINESLLTEKEPPGVLVEKIIVLLRNMASDSGEPFFKWIKPREDIYKGPFISRFPHIVFEMHQPFGFDGMIDSENLLIDRVFLSSTGSHKFNSPVLRCLNLKNRFINNGKENSIDNFASSFLTPGEKNEDTYI